MNKYIIVEDLGESFPNSAGGKARIDIQNISKQMDIEEIRISLCKCASSKTSPYSHLKVHLKTFFAWVKSLNELNNAYLIIQFPLERKFFLFAYLLKKLKKKNIRTIAVIHDIEALRTTKSVSMNVFEKKWIINQEITPLKQFDYIISHNAKMSQYLVSIGLIRNTIVDLKIFDYLVNESSNSKTISPNNSVAIAGNLMKEKAGYVYKLPRGVSFELYGPCYGGPKDDNIHYHGIVPSTQLPNILNSKFGLIWDGNSDNTCDGFCGDYLKYNNPHKTSLYLAAGIPVLIWKYAAMRDFIVENGLGIEIESLQEIPDVMASCEDNQYAILKSHIEIISTRLRNGYYFKSALNTIFNLNN